MGEVYRAQDERLRRIVAIKILPGEIASHAERRARILAEARAAAALNHPSITTIYEVGEEGDQVFIVMELVSGKTLRAFLSEGSAEPRTVLRLGAQVAEALAIAHAQGVIHSDIKPENIVLQTEGRVKLLDFGIASQLAAESVTLTRNPSGTSWLPDSQIAGTLAYMAPEQLRGEPSDARTDLFSLGILLYELSSGHRPFPGPTATVLAQQILHDAPPALSACASGLPTELVRIVHKLLEKQPERRYQSAREVQVDLTNLSRDLELGITLPAVAAGKQGVAVLPFKLLTPSAEDEYLSIALADAVINQLGASGELLVRPTSTVMRYAKQSVDPLLAARELNVQVVVDGSIQKFGGKLRAHVQAWNAATGTAVYSAKHDGEIAELFSLQDELADGLTQALGVQCDRSGGRPVKTPTDNPRAYELFLRASERLARLNRWDTRTAIEMLEQAVVLDPEFADAWARLAEACALIGVTQEPHPKWLKRADHAIRRALRLDRHNAEVYCASGRVLWTPARGFKHRQALRALNEALQINPGCHAAQIWRCLILMHLGLLEDAKKGLLEALATHPEDALTLVFIGQTALYRGDFEEAEEFQERALRIDPANIWGNGFAPTTLLYGGHLSKAEEKIRMARQVLQDDPWLASCEALLCAKRGEKRKAEGLLRRSLQPAKSFLHTHHMWHTAAASYALLGNPAAAVKLLQRASAHGLPNYPVFRGELHFQSLQTYPAFRALLGKLKREWYGYQREFGRQEPS